MSKHSLFLAPVALGLLLVVTPAAALNDPTRPPASRAPAPTAAPAPAVALQLSSILHGEERRLARINGSWVAEGEVVAGARVLRIEPNAVRVRSGNQVTTLTLQVGGMQKQPAQRDS